MINKVGTIKTRGVSQCRATARTKYKCDEIKIGFDKEITKNIISIVDDGAKIGFKKYNLLISEKDKKIIKILDITYFAGIGYSVGDGPINYGSQNSLKKIFKMDENIQHNIFTKDDVKRGCLDYYAG